MTAAILLALQVLLPFAVDNLGSESASLAEAGKELRKGRYLQAVSHFEHIANVGEPDPDTKRACAIGIATAQAKLGAFSSALAGLWNYAGAHGQRPDPEISQAIIRVLLESGSVHAAALEVDAFLCGGGEPSDDSFIIDIADLLARSDRPLSAEHWLEKLNSEPASAELKARFHEVRARLALANHNASAARAAACNAMRIKQESLGSIDHPDLLPPLLLCAGSQLANGEVDQAALLLTSAQELVKTYVPDNLYRRYHVAFLRAKASALAGTAADAKPLIMEATDHEAALFAELSQTHSKLLRSDLPISTEQAMHLGELAWQVGESELRRRMATLATATAHLPFRIERDRDIRRVHAYEGAARLAVGDYDGASEHLRRASVRSACGLLFSDADTLIALSDSATMGGNFESAEEALLKAIVAARPDSEEYFNAKARLASLYASKLQRPEDAIQIYDEIVAKLTALSRDSHPLVTESLLAQAEIASGLGKLDLVQTMAEQLLTRAEASVPLTREQYAFALRRLSMLDIADDPALTAQIRTALERVERFPSLVTEPDLSIAARILEGAYSKEVDAVYDITVSIPPDEAVPFSIEFGVLSDACRDALNRLNLHVMGSRLQIAMKRMKDHNDAIFSREEDKRAAFSHVITHWLDLVEVAQELVDALGQFQLATTLRDYLIGELDPVLKADAPMRFELLMRAGSSWELRGYLEEAMALYRRAESSLDSDERDSVAGAALFQRIADVSLSMNDSATAKVYLDKAWRIRNTLGQEVDPRGMVSLLESTADADATLLRPFAASDGYKDAIGLLTPLVDTNSEHLLRLQLKLGFSQLDAGRVPQAKTAMVNSQKIINRRTRTGTRLHAESAHLSGRVALSERHLESAKRAFDRAREFYQDPLSGQEQEDSTGDSKPLTRNPTPMQLLQIARIHIQLSRVAQIMQHYDTAIDELTRAMDHLQRGELTQHPRVLVRLLLESAGVYRDLGQIEVATNALNRAMRIIDESLATEPLLRARVLVEQGVCNLRQGRLEAAKELLSSAHGISKQETHERNPVYIDSAFALLDTSFRLSGYEGSSRELEVAFSFLSRAASDGEPDSIVARPVIVEAFHTALVEARRSNALPRESLEALVVGFERLIGIQSPYNLVKYAMDEGLHKDFDHWYGPPDPRIATYALTLGHEAQSRNDSEKLLTYSRLARRVISGYAGGALRVLPRRAQVDFIAGQVAPARSHALALLIGHAHPSDEFVNEASNWAIETKGLISYVSSTRELFTADQCIRLGNQLDVLLLNARRYLQAFSNDDPAAAILVDAYQDQIERYEGLLVGLHRLNELKRGHRERERSRSAKIAAAWRGDTSDVLDEPRLTDADPLVIPPLERALARQLAVLRTELETWVAVRLHPNPLHSDSNIGARLKELNQEELRLGQDALATVAEMLVAPPKSADAGNVDAEGRSLVADHPFVDFVLFADLNGERRYGAFIMPSLSASAIRYVDLGPAAELDSMIEDFHYAASDANGDWLSIGPRLRQRVWDPLMTFLPSGPRVIISPDARLWLVPWHALPSDDGDSFLLHNRCILLATSARQTRKGAGFVIGSGAVVFADPSLEGKPWVSVSETRRVATALMDAYKARTEDSRGPVKDFVGPNATEANLLAVHRPQVFAFCSHAFYGVPEGFSHLVADDPFSAAGLVLSGANQRPEPTMPDGIVLASELIDLELRGTSLVILGGCKTASGLVAAGEAVFGLREAFHHAGAENVVAAQWKIPERQSVHLLERVIRTMDFSKGGFAAAECLRQAQLELIRSGASTLLQTQPVSGLPKMLGTSEVEEMDPQLEKAARARKTPLAPHYWAGFVVSGPP